MERIKIFYFSGTGNTALVGGMFESNLKRLGCAVETIRMEDALKGRAEVSVEDCGLIGIGSPVIGYGAPPIVYRFLRSLPKAKGKRVFIFRTAGGVAPINYNASGTMRRILKRRGYRVFHERLFSVGSNWIVRFGNEAVRKLRDATEAKVALTCERILAGEERRPQTSMGLRAAMRPARFLSSLSLRFMAKDLRATADCTRCGRCVRDCPEGNIREAGGKIRFGSSCSSCMRCVYSCPRGAIAFKNLAFFPVKGGYDLRGILETPERFPDEGAKAAPPFLAEYVGNPEF